MTILKLYSVDSVMKGVAAKVWFDNYVGHAVCDVGLYY